MKKDTEIQKIKIKYTYGEFWRKFYNNFHYSIIKKREIKKNWWGEHALHYYCITVNVVFVSIRLLFVI